MAITYFHIERRELQNIERRELQNQSSSLAKLQYKQEEYKKVELRYKKSLTEIESKILLILNENKLPQMNNLQEKFIKKNKLLRKQYEIACEKYNKLQTEQSVTENELLMLSNEKNKISENLSENIIKLSSSKLSLDIDMNELISAAKEKQSNKQSDFALAKCGRTLYSKFNNLAKKKTIVLYVKDYLRIIQN
eukprot:528825_1